MKWLYGKNSVPAKQDLIHEIIEWLVEHNEKHGNKIEIFRPREPIQLFEIIAKYDRKLYWNNREELLETMKELEQSADIAHKEE